MLQPKRAVKDPTLKGMLKEAGARPKAWLIKRGTLPLIVADRASDVARGAYDQGQQYVRQASDRYPQAQRYYQRATQSIEHQITKAPLVSLLAVGAVGLGMAWIIGGLTRSQDRAPSGQEPKGLPWSALRQAADRERPGGRNCRLRPERQAHRHRRAGHDR